MKEKQCFKCGKVLPITEFYRHSQMGDGHLNKCKECTKKDAYKRYSRKSKDESWLELERARGREKYKRLKYKDKFKRTRSICSEESRISRMLRARGYDTIGKEAHHWNYNIPYSVFLLSRRAHKCIHKYIHVNYSNKLCYTRDGVVIDTLEKAKSLFRKWLDINGIGDNLVHVNIKPLTNRVYKNCTNQSKL